MALYRSCRKRVFLSLWHHEVKIDKRKVTGKNMIVSISEDDLISIGKSNTPFLIQVILPFLQHLTTWLAENLEASNLKINASLTAKYPVGNNDGFTGTEKITDALLDISGIITPQIILDDIPDRTVQMSHYIT
ncbi:MAG TPA: hypothetical protein VJ911_06135 [Cryomorphaceae bacterium]|nr:hypothetical protein [Cryomorphaceae bacterium]